MFDCLDTDCIESDDKLRDECGVIGVYLKHPTQQMQDELQSAQTTQQQSSANQQSAQATSQSLNASLLAYYGLYSLQHRGQESAGIAVSDGTSIKLCKQLGLVSEVFTPTNLEELKGDIALGHVRYATAGGRTVENAQPMLNKFKLGSIALAHNGQLVNYEPLQEMLEETGSTFTSTSDTEIILKLIARNYKKGLEKAVENAIQLIKGSFALCVMTENCLIGARDPYGIRPLCLGQVENGWILASESCAIDAMNGTFVRDVKPGEIVIITEEGLKSIELQEQTSKQTCIFEYVYFARPDSVIDGIPVQLARLKMGEILAIENPVEADVVIGVPDSGIGAALGYSATSGIPYAMGIVKNKYIGRTFIAPTQKERENMVFVKLNAIKSDLYGKRVIVIDDSIVRGTTSRRLVQILRKAGAKEVHFRVSSPPVRFPCYLGIDTPTKAELISSAHDVEQIRKEIGADSLSFITLDGMIEALRLCAPVLDGFCKGCFSGIYPVGKV